jgi:hypothetical protein
VGAIIGDTWKGIKLRRLRPPGIFFLAEIFIRGINFEVFLVIGLVVEVVSRIGLQ